MSSNLNRKLRSYERSWIAATIDCEGSIGLYKKKDHKGKCKLGFSWQPCVQASNTNVELLRKLKILCGGWINDGAPPGKGHLGLKLSYHWAISSNQIRVILPQIKKYLIIKKEQARLLSEALTLSSLKINNQYTITEKRNRRLNEIYTTLKKLNH